MTEDEAIATLIRSARHWLKEISNLTKVIDDEEVIGMYLVELNRVQEALDVLDRDHRYPMDPDFNVSVLVQFGGPTP